MLSGYNRFGTNTDDIYTFTVDIARQQKKRRQKSNRRRLEKMKKEMWPAGFRNSGLAEGDGDGSIRLSWIETTDLSIGVARIFSEGCIFLDQKSYDFFLVITFCYMVICVIYCHQLPFLSHMWGCTSPNSAPFLPRVNKNAQKNFFRHPGGVPAPPAPSWIRLWI